MPGKINLVPHYREIQDWLNDGCTYADIADRLLVSYDIWCSPKSVQRAVKAAGIQVREPQWQNTPQLRARVIYLFHNTSLTDDEMADLLKLDGHVIGARRLQTYRLHELGLKKRLLRHQHAEMDRTIDEILGKEMEEGHIEDYGRRNLYQYIRSKYNIVGR